MSNITIKQSCNLTMLGACHRKKEDSSDTSLSSDSLPEKKGKGKEAAVVDDDFETEDSPASENYWDEQSATEEPPPYRNGNRQYAYDHDQHGEPSNPRHAQNRSETPLNDFPERQPPQARRRFMEDRCVLCSACSHDALR